MNTSDKTPAPVEFAALLAFDWSDQKHDVRLLMAGKDQAESLVVPNSPEQFHPWRQQLRQRVGGKPIAVGFEAHRGAWSYRLQPFDFLHLFPINPKSAARFREALYPSGSKNDPLDVDLILELPQKHRSHLVGLSPDTPETRLLGLLSEQRRQWVDERTALVNQLGARLKSYFPQAIELGGGDLTKPLAWDLLQRGSSLAAIKKAKPEVLRKFYYAHNSRSEERIQARLELVSKAEALTNDTAILEASILQALALVRQWAVVQKCVDEYEARLEQLLDEHPDGVIFRSLPGAGTGDGGPTFSGPGDPSRALERCRGVTGLQRCGSGDRQQWQEPPGHQPLGSPAICAPKLCRICQMFADPMSVGPRTL